MYDTDHVMLICFGNVEHTETPKADNNSVEDSVIDHKERYK